MKTIYAYDSLPCVDRCGHIALNIYPPGTFCDNTDFGVFVGGCGVGHRKTLKGAQDYLLEAAKRQVIKRIEEAEKTAEHYEKVLEHLDRQGLGRVRKEDR
jgi:hypothetical protein